MITHDSSIQEQINFFSSKIKQYYSVINRFEIGSEHFTTYIKWIDGWNDQVVVLKKELIKNERQ